MAAHLERVAKQARELAKLLEPHLGDAEWWTEEAAVETIAEFLAAALAACAREEAKLARKALREMDSRALFETWLDSHIKCLEIAALERAVGEKA